MLTVLVVEHDDDVRQHVVGAVHAYGFRALGARNAREGIALLRSETVEAVFTDYVLDPHRETGCWMLLLAYCEKRLGAAELLVICTSNHYVQAPTSLPHAKVVRKPMGALEIQTFLRHAHDAKVTRNSARPAPS